MWGYTIPMARGDWVMACRRIGVTFGAGIKSRYAFLSSEAFSEAGKQFACFSPVSYLTVCNKTL